MFCFGIYKTSFSHDAAHLELFKNTSNKIPCAPSDDSDQHIYIGIMSCDSGNNESEVHMRKNYS